MVKGGDWICVAGEDQRGGIEERQVRGDVRLKSSFDDCFVYFAEAYQHEHRLRRWLRESGGRAVFSRTGEEFGALISIMANGVCYEPRRVLWRMSSGFRRKRH